MTNRTQQKINQVDERRVSKWDIQAVRVSTRVVKALRKRNTKGWYAGPSFDGVHIRNRENGNSFVERNEGNAIAEEMEKVGLLREKKTNGRLAINRRSRGLTRLGSGLRNP